MVAGATASATKPCVGFVHSYGHCSACPVEMPPGIGPGGGAGGTGGTVELPPRIGPTGRTVGATGNTELPNLGDDTRGETLVGDRVVVLREAGGVRTVKNGRTVNFR